MATCVFVGAEMCLPSRFLAVNVYSDSTVPWERVEMAFIHTKFHKTQSYSYIVIRVHTQSFCPSLQNKTLKVEKNLHSLCKRQELVVPDFATSSFFLGLKVE
jgi:hypothetical protein